MRLRVGASDLGRLLSCREPRPTSIPGYHAALDQHLHDENAHCTQAPTFRVSVTAGGPPRAMTSACPRDTCENLSEARDMVRE